MKTCSNDYVLHIPKQPTLDAAVAPVQDVIARFKEQHSDFNELPSKAVFTMNDTHPTIAVAELMRLLIDQEGLEWDNAWAITTKVIFIPCWPIRIFLLIPCIPGGSHTRVSRSKSFEDLVCSFRAPYGAKSAQLDFPVANKLLLAVVPASVVAFL